MSELLVAGAQSVESKLARAVDEFMAAGRRGDHPAVEEFADRFPEVADELRRVLPALALLGSSGPHSDLGEPEFGDLGDFRLIREVGRGGMGVVYEAEQLSLSRRVALKVLPYAGAMDPKQIQRFKNEAKAAASLQHDHIVSVHAIGCERGVHFYAMEFVDGQTLADVIAEIRRQEEEIHHRDTEDTEKRNTAEWNAKGIEDTQKREKTVPVSSLCSLCLGGKKSSFFRQAAELVANAADALEHAHSLGIVHRDVKPANLLLDAAGQVYVSDFGLARLGADAGLTISGDLLGTLRYMAPEQALARHGLVDHRADVYGLGCTLYELLTGRHAVNGIDRADILRGIAFEEPTAPRRIEKSIPAELETITLKALAKNPNERYATAGEFAEDLRRWLGNHAIKAKPPGVRERAAKWIRRHQTFARMSVVILLLAVTGLAISTWLIWNEKEAVRLAKIDTETQRDRAAKARDRTFEALDAMTSAVTGASLQSQSAISTEQWTFLTNVLGYYEEFAAEQAEDEQTRKRIAAAATRLGDIHIRLGAREKAAKAFQQALGAYLTLTADFPAVPDYRWDLARCYGMMGFLLEEFGKHREAEAAYLQALTILMQLAEEFPSEHQYRGAIANSYDNLGMLFKELGKPKEAETACREGLALRENLTAEFPHVPPYWSSLAASYHNLGNLFLLFGNRTEANKSYQKAVAIHEKLVSEFPAEPTYRRYLANHHQGLGNHKQALEIRQKLVAEFPSVPEYRYELAKCHGDLGRHYRELGKETEAEASFRHGMSLLEKLATDFPTMRGYRFSLAITQANLGDMLHGLGKTAEAEANMQSAFALPGRRFAPPTSVEPVSGRLGRYAHPQHNRSPVRPRPPDTVRRAVSPRHSRRP